MYSQGTYETSTRKNFQPQNTHKKKIGIHRILTKKHFGPTKYPQENITDPQRQGGRMS